MESTEQIQYYKEILEAVASKSTCNRAKVGSIIIKEKCIISTGYNGSPRGLTHCGEKHLMVQNHCINTVHSEVNSILTACRNGININGCDMYSLLIHSGIKNCYYFYDYTDPYQSKFEKNEYCQFIKIIEHNLNNFVEKKNVQDIDFI
jgi:deoxycytidylate deaminase